MQVAQIILQQLGGNKFIAMTGTKIQYGKENAIALKLTPNKSKSKWLTITLQESDTYTMHFQKEAKSGIVTVAKHENVYCDMLQKIFTEVTGLYTKL